MTINRHYEKKSDRIFSHNTSLDKIERKKWKKFLKRVRLFRFTPFVAFVLAAGSLATGKLHKKSDFDVIIGVKQDRIFTARFFAVLFFTLLGWRRSKLDHKENASDKICLNHFVTSKSYRLNPPHNEYWNYLYENLVPVMGNEDLIKEFFRANDWMSPPRSYKRDRRYLGKGNSLLKKFSEWFLGGRFGDEVEKILKRDQVKRIEAGLPQSLGYKPRFLYNDDELEFHPDTSRIEAVLKRLDKDYPRFL